MKLFNQAAIIVAPHGAGLVNAVFSQPSTVIIEVLCAHQDSVLCYPYLMRNLGHIYYGLRHDKYKYLKFCNNISVDIDVLRKVVLTFISNL